MIKFRDYEPEGQKSEWSDLGEAGKKDRGNSGHNLSYVRDFILHSDRTRREAPLKKVLNALAGDFVYADLFSQFAHPLKDDLSIDFGIEGVVLPHTHIVPRMNLCALLPNKDIAGTDNLTAVSLDPESLPRAVPAVSGTSSRFLVCHDCSSLF